MRKRIIWFVGVVVTLIWLAPAGVPQTGPKYEELPNFHRVNENLYRGAQPKPAGFEKLAEMGIKTVINLRDDDGRARAEETKARAAGLRYFNLPMDDFGRPAEEKVRRVLAIINAPENQPVFVHCRRGADRTGTIVAVYRIEHDGWTSERAKSEANQYGMALWQVGMKHYIEDHYRRRQRSGSEQIPSRVPMPPPNNSGTAITLRASGKFWRHVDVNVGKCMGSCGNLWTMNSLGRLLLLNV